MRVLGRILLILAVMGLVAIGFRGSGEEQRGEIREVEMYEVPWRVEPGERIWIRGYEYRVVGVVEWEGAEMVGGESVVFVVRTGF